MSRKRHNGMTLLEVLVAMMILAVGCMAVIRTTGQQVRNLGKLEDKMVAGWVADNQLARLYLGDVVLSPLWQQGNSMMANRQWFWRCRSRQTTDSQLQAIEIEVDSEPEFSYPILRLRTWRINHAGS
ncbi:type II secretion system protein GspI [Serratia proteamaculans]|uniref:type II secretion system minor pseudopilin GspI n=1 Tax=Serratia proteamaculans TaxID=28151 RepID=UPI00107633BE|nr:type II secretion system minor pseudopilin GspI [Serratia proteamaculans]TFZ48869.1 type II secretion system protein GspI [Serratia proteamaculans]